MSLIAFIMALLKILHPGLHRQVCPAPNKDACHARTVKPPATRKNRHVSSFSYGDFPLWASMWWDWA